MDSTNKLGPSKKSTITLKKMESTIPDGIFHIIVNINTGIIGYSIESPKHDIKILVGQNGLCGPIDTPLPNEYENTLTQFHQFLNLDPNSEIALVFELPLAGSNVTLTSICGEKLLSDYDGNVNIKFLVFRLQASLGKYLDEIFRISNLIYMHNIDFTLQIELGESKTTPNSFELSKIKRFLKKHRHMKFFISGYLPEKGYNDIVKHNKN